MKFRLFHGVMLSIPLFFLPAPTSHAGVASLDWDGDGADDPGVYEARSGTWRIILSGSGEVRSDAHGWRRGRAVPGDYDGDGRADHAAYDRESGLWFISPSASEPTTRLWGWKKARAVPGDYDGDGRTDLAVYWSGQGLWAFAPSGDPSLHLLALAGDGRSRAVPGDYDGDGRTDPALYERSQGVWRWRGSLTGQVHSVSLGEEGGRPVPGDYDGDGRTDPALYSKEGRWSILESTTGGLRHLSPPLGGGEPAPGDYDGDGLTDAAVYDRARGRWAIFESSTGAVRSATLGGEWAAPLPAFLNGATAGLDVLCFGDSIFYGRGTDANGPASSFTPGLESLLEPELGGHSRAINAGKPGETTGAGEDRLLQELEESRPETVIIMEGTNDHFSEKPFAEIEANLRHMVESALDRDTLPVLATVPPVIKSENCDRRDQNERIVAFNPTIRALAARYRIPLAPVYETVTSVPNWEHTLMDRDTCNHLNDAGHLLLRELFFGTLHGLSLEGRLP